jgi:hypothetical protein
VKTTNHFASNALPLPEGGEKLPAKSALSYRFFEVQKSKTNSKALSHLLEFLTQVFAQEKSSRFFKTFLLRFISDSNKSPDDSLSLTFLRPFSSPAF